METPVKKRKAEIDEFGVIRMVLCNSDPYTSPGKGAIVNGSPISKLGKIKRQAPNSPIGVLIIDPNITPPAQP